MHQHAAKHLLGRVKEPDAHGPLRPLAPALVHEREQRQRAEGELHQDGEGAEQAAFCGLVGVVVGGAGVRGVWIWGGGGG